MAKDKNKDQANSEAEGTTPEATEGNEAAAATEAPAKPAGPTPEELLSNLRTAVSNAISGAAEDGTLAPETVQPLQDAYRRIPAARRGSVQADVLKEAMSAEGVNHQAVASVLEEMTKAPEAKPRATRAAKPEVPAHIVLAQSLSALDVARLALVEGIDSEIVAQATALADANLASGIESDEDRESILARATKAANAVRAKARRSGGGSGGPRVAKTEGLAQLFERGDLKEGDVLKAGERTATITSDGKIAVGDQTFENPTAAAKGAGVTSSVNGWAFWTVERDGKNVPVGDLRKS